jgi:hypothetical protein
MNNKETIEKHQLWQLQEELGNPCENSDITVKAVLIEPSKWLQQASMVWILDTQSIRIRLPMQCIQQICNQLLHAVAQNAHMGFTARNTNILMTLIYT